MIRSRSCSQEIAKSGTECSCTIHPTQLLHVQKTIHDVTAHMAYVANVRFLSLPEGECWASLEESESPDPDREL